MLIMYVSFRVVCVSRSIAHIIMCVPRSIACTHTHIYVYLCVYHVAERLCLTGVYVRAHGDLDRGVTGGGGGAHVFCDECKHYRCKQLTLEPRNPGTYNGESPTPLLPLLPPSSCLLLRTRLLPL